MVGMNFEKYIDGDGNTHTHAWVCKSISEILSHILFLLHTLLWCSCMLSHSLNGFWLLHFFLLAHSHMTTNGDYGFLPLSFKGDGSAVGVNLSSWLTCVEIFGFI
jgi:hypothetical protein